MSMNMNSSVQVIAIQRTINGTPNVMPINVVHPAITKHPVANGFLAG